MVAVPTPVDLAETHRVAGGLATCRGEVSAGVSGRRSRGQLGGSGRRQADRRRAKGARLEATTADQT
jgi:hypothetical protein